MKQQITPQNGIDAAQEKKKDAAKDTVAFDAAEDRKAKVAAA